MEDLFSWIVEGVLLISIASIGLFGNSLSLLVFSRQKKHRVFHNLFLLLTVFDMIYVICSLLIFSIPKFSSTYKNSYRIRFLPWTLPLAHISLMGSVYCTVAITIERFITVCYPFVAHRHVFSTSFFAVPIVFFTIIYNIPKFFELRVVECSSNCSSSAFTIEPTPLRRHVIYVRVYILWMNLIFYILIPFLLLIFLNIKVYQGCRTFENTFTENIRVCFSSLLNNEAKTTSSREDSSNNNNNASAPKSINDIRSSRYYHSISSLRRREVVLAKISIYITFVFLFCHSVRLILNAYEMYSTYIEDSANKRKPSWFKDVSRVSHLLLTFASSANFFIYYFKYGLHNFGRRQPSTTT